MRVTLGILDFLAADRPSIAFRKNKLERINHKSVVPILDSILSFQNAIFNKFPATGLISSLIPGFVFFASFSHFIPFKVSQCDGVSDCPAALVIS
jgi:hypothetical protein